VTHDDIIPVSKLGKRLIAMFNANVAREGQALVVDVAENDDIDLRDFDLDANKSVWVRKPVEKRDGLAD
jgi:hypothetical protein